MVMNRAASGLILRGDHLAYCFVVKTPITGLIVAVNDMGLLKVARVRRRDNPHGRLAVRRGFDTSAPKLAQAARTPPTRAWSNHA